jgi:hypothetical protein
MLTLKEDEKQVSFRPAAGKNCRAAGRILKNGGVMEKPIYVLGHRNPDTDSICAAIGYAFLKKQLGANAIPARAGKINPETRFVLDYFQVPDPLLVHDLFPSRWSASLPAATWPGTGIMKFCSGNRNERT